MSARKKGPAKAPKQKMVDASKLSTRRMTAGGEKKYPVVIDGGILKTWVGFGWVRERKAQKKDYDQYPVVTRDGAP